MSKVDLFGGMSSDEEDENTAPTHTTSTLMAEMEMSDDDEEPTCQAIIDEKIISISPELKTRKSVEKLECPDSKKPKMILNDEDSMDMPDVEQMVKDNLAKMMELERKRKMEAFEAAQKLLEPVTKRSKDIGEELNDSSPQPKPSLLPSGDVEPVELIKKKIKEEKYDFVAEKEDVYPELYEDDNEMEEEDQIQQLKMQVLLKNMSKEQLERYEAYRRSKFQRTTIRSLIKEFTGGVAIADNVVIAVAALSKMVVGDIVEEALDLRDANEEEAKLPLHQHHINQAFLKLKREGNL